MNCDYTYNTPDGLDHVLFVMYAYHGGYPATMQDPPEHEYCEIDDWVCQTHDDCKLNDGNIPDRELERMERHCLEHYLRTV